MRKVRKPSLSLKLRLPGRKGGTEKKPRSSRASRFVLTIGDEGAILLHLVKGKVAERYFTPTFDAPETAALETALKASPRHSVRVVFDVAEQAYVQQTLPPVSRLSLGKLMKKRLDREFSADYLKNAMILGRDKKGRKDWQFMMVALQSTPVISGWMERVLEWPNRCESLCLLPVESVEVGAKLRRKLGDQDSGWYFLVSYNKVSGLRQVISHDNRMVLTRLGQPAVGDNAEAIAGTIEQEIVGTYTYLRRLMQSESHRPELIVIAAEDVKRHIDAKRLDMEQVHLLTPHEAAQMLDIASATQPTDSYGDVALAAAIGLRLRPKLTVLTPLLRKQHAAFAGLLGLRGLAALIGLFLLFQLANNMWNIYSINTEMGALEQKNLKKQRELEGLKEKAATAQEDLEKIADTVNLYELLHAESYSPEALLTRLAGLLDANVQVTAATWQLGEKPPPAPPVVELQVDMQFSPQISGDRKQLQQTVVETLNRLKTGLSGYEVNYSSLPAAVSDTEQINLSLTPSGVKSAQGAAKAVAKLTIKGPAVEPEKTDAKPVQ